VTVWAHVLAGSDAIGRAATNVENIVLRLLGKTRQALAVNVDPRSGWISVVARDQIVDRQRPTLVTADDARRRAEKFLLDLAGSLAPSPDQPLVFMPPLPSSPVELALVPHASRPEWNHWIYRTIPQLPTARGAPPAPVIGSAIEIRIGDGGQIIGYHARWRPTTGERRSCEQAALPAAEPKRAAPRPVYVLDGLNVPQHYLALHYLVDEGADFELVSGCSLALTVELELADTETTTRVRAIASGGTGNYAYSWARYAMSDPFAGIEELGAGTLERGDSGTSSTIELAKGAPIVMVHVVDLATGAFKHYQQLVVSSPFATRQEPVLAELDAPFEVRIVEEPAE